MYTFLTCSRFAKHSSFVWKQVTSDEFAGTIGSGVVFRMGVEGSQECWLPWDGAAEVWRDLGGKRVLPLRGSR